MRIAILSSNFIRMPPEPDFVPPGMTGASERVMYTLTESLVTLGHDVTLFATGDSKTRAKLISVTPIGGALDPSIGIGPHVDFEYLLISRCIQMANSGAFDLIHSIFDIRSAILAPFCHIPIVSTLHSPLVGIKHAILSQIPDSQYYVSITNAQRRVLPELRYTATVYHGIEISDYPLGDGRGGYILMAGRIVKKKGFHVGIEAARRADKQLTLLGDAPPKSPYWNRQITPFIDGIHVVHKGFIEKSLLVQYYQQASAFLMPIMWEEPFGMVMIEAMACGTPIIAYNRGSVPEVVIDGVTGFIIDPPEGDETPYPLGKQTIKKRGIDGLVEAIARIGDIDRSVCRKHVEEHFTVGKMVKGYEVVYAKILASK